MEKLRTIGNTVVFRCRYFHIKVRDMTIVLLLLLFASIALIQCQSSGYIDEIAALEDTCVFPKRNLHALQDLLERSDLCSERWFVDCDDYIHRLQQQNDRLETMKGSRSQELYGVQKAVVEALTTFYKEQSDMNLQQLQDTVERYQKQYQGICKGEGNYE